MSRDLTTIIEITNLLPAPVRIKAYSFARGGYRILGLRRNVELGINPLAGLIGHIGLPDVDCQVDRLLHRTLSAFVLVDHASESLQDLLKFLDIPCHYFQSGMELLAAIDSERVSIKTVEKYRRRLYEKLDVCSAAELSRAVTLANLAPLLQLTLQTRAA